MTSRKRALGLLACVGLFACRSYEPRPIVPQRVLDDLNAIRLGALRADLAPRESSARVPAELDLSNGLSLDEAVLVAVVANPDLNSFRRERGVAEGELIAAGLLSNPTINVGALMAVAGGPVFDVLPFWWSPPRPGELAKRQDRARHRIDEVRAEIAEREWQLATDVRKAWLSVVAAEEQLRIADAAVRLRERILAWIKDRRELGDANAVDVNLVEIELVSTVRERIVAENERNRVRLELHRLLGVPPHVSVPLEVEGDPLAFERVPIAPPVLESVMVHNRPRLQAALAVYEQAEVDVDLAYLYRWPWFGVGPAYEREAESNDPVNERVGVNLTIVNVPVFNQNQGQIAITEARRERLRLDFAARVHEGRAELHEAIRNLRAQESLIDLFHARIRPALEENASLTEAGFEMHEFHLVQLITTQDLVLRNRREFVRAQLEHGKAIYDLERAIGAPVAPPR